MFIFFSFFLSRLVFRFRMSRVCRFFGVLLVRFSFMVFRFRCNLRVRCLFVFCMRCRRLVSRFFMRFIFRFSGVLLFRRFFLVVRFRFSRCSFIFKGLFCRRRVYLRILGVWDFSSFR